MTDVDGRLPCPDCRLRLPDPASLRRHARLDHTPAPDGLDLLRLALGGLPPRPDWAERAGSAVVLGWALALVVVLVDTAA